MKRFKDHPLLPESEINQLVQIFQKTGDMSAAERVITHNERFIYRMAEYYLDAGTCGDQEMDDLMQYGRMGMLRAMQDFDTNSGNKFLTYAYNWVRMFIKRYGRRAGQQVYMSDQAREDRAVIGKAEAEFVQKNHRKPTVDELAKITGLKKKKVDSLYFKVYSLDDDLGNGNGALNSYITMGERLPDPNADTAVDGVNAAVISQIMEKLKRLPRQDQFVITNLFGLNGHDPRSREQIAREMKITPYQVDKIKETALLWLREPTILDFQEIGIQN